MFGSNKARSDKQAQMAFHKTLPFDVFRHILSFKDPTRQVGVKGGIKTDSASAMPPYFDPRDVSPVWALWPDGVVMTRRDMYYTSRGRRSFLFIWDTDEVGDLAQRYPWDGTMVQEFEMSSKPLERPPSELWLQCESCGPDLELYDMLR